MSLLLLDLDNTLLPRDAVYRAWARDFLAERSLPPEDLEWFTTIDGGGLTPRETVLAAARRRYGLELGLEPLLSLYRRGINERLRCPDGHRTALRTARAAGWTLGIVSNGATRLQTDKIRRTGLAHLVDGWVISEEAHCAKPDPEIFRIAAQRCGVPTAGAWASRTWMIGDQPTADVAGARISGLHSVWLHRGRPWPEPGFRPTCTASDLPEAVTLAMAADAGTSPLLDVTDRPGPSAHHHRPVTPAAG